MVSLPSPSITRRLTATMFVSQCLVSMAFLAVITVGPLINTRMGGSRALAGLPSTLIVLGSALAAYPIGRLTDRIGRRRGLASGLLLGMFGAFIGAVAVSTGSYLGFLLGLLLMGCARAAGDQVRFAAAEVSLPANRARALSLVVFGSTVGAVFGPALVAPTSRFAQSLQVPELAGPLIASTILYGLATSLFFLLLRPDPRAIGQQIAAALAAQTARGAQAVSERLRTAAEIFRTPSVLVAMSAMTFGQMAMLLIMSVTSLHMADHNHDLGNISLVISGHTLGMFGFSIITGWLVDKLGAYKLIGAGVILTIIGAQIGPLSLELGWLSLALFLVGLGWNFCFVAGSTLLSSALRPAERGQIQGTSDLIAGLASGTASLSSGVILQQLGYGGLCFIGALIILIPALLMFWQRIARPAEAVRSST